MRSALGILPALLLAAYALGQAASGYGAPSLAAPARSQAQGGQAAYVERFAALHEHLAGTPVAGYAYRRSASDRLSRGAYFFLAQYALAPTLLTRDTKPALVVGNFNTPEALAAFLAKTRLIVVADFGDGVVLLRHADRSRGSRSQPPRARRQPSRRAEPPR